jgi:putative hemolysin
MNLVLGIVFFFGLALSFLFSGMESGMLSTNRLALRRRARQGDKSAASLMGYLDETESFLWTVLVGNTLANLMIVAPLLWALRALMPSYPWGSAILLVALLLILYAFCDLLPKLLYRHFPDQLTVASVRPYQLFHGLLSPLVFVVSGFADLLHRITGGKTLSARLFSNRDEMRQMMALSSQNLTIEETSMIDRVMDLKSRSLVSVMTPIHEVVSLNAKDTIEHAVGVAREESLMRFPVFDLHDGQRVFMGVFLFKTLLHDWQQCRQEHVGEHLTGVLRLSSTLSVDEALKKMLEAGQRVALIVDDAQKEMGWVNLRDILKIIFGEVNL